MTSADAQAGLEPPIRSEPSKVQPSDRKLGRYELLYELGSGGMASVFLARARGPAGFLKHFAIKRVHQNLAKNASFVDMFLDEARIAAALEHPNIAQVIDLGEADGSYFLAMEYLHGEPLVRVLNRSVERGAPLSANIAAYVIARVAEALHHAHTAKDSRGQPMNLVHRDVSPHNVFVTYDGRVKLTDFGVAKAVGRITETETGELKGKIAYCSPEQARGDAIDGRSDVFALGVVLWELVTGRRLFRAQSHAETVWRIVRAQHAPPSSIVAGLPPEIDRVVDRALAPSPGDRYRTAREMARDLDVVAGERDEPRGSEILAAMMRDLFAREIERRDAALYDESNEPPRAAVAREESEVRRARGRTLAGWTIATIVLAAAGGLALAGVYRGANGDTVVRVESTPSGARLWVDGALLAERTPAVLEAIDRGPHRIALEHDGYRRLEESFDANADRVALEYRLLAVENGPPEVAPSEPVAVAPTAPSSPPGVEAALASVGLTGGALEAGSSDGAARAAPRPRAAPAHLTLITRPWARVWLGTQELGSTPFTNREVPSGRLRLRIQREGVGPVRTVVIRAAPGERVSRNLELTD